MRTKDTRIQYYARCGKVFVRKFADHFVNKQGNSALLQAGNDVVRVVASQTPLGMRWVAI